MCACVRSSWSLPILKKANNNKTIGQLSIQLLKVTLLIFYSNVNLVHQRGEKKWEDFQSWKYSHCDVTKGLFQVAVKAGFSFFSLVLLPSNANLWKVQQSRNLLQRILWNVVNKWLNALFSRVVSSSIWMQGCSYFLLLFDLIFVYFLLLFCCCK